MKIGYPTAPDVLRVRTIMVNLYIVRTGAWMLVRAWYTRCERIGKTANRSIVVCELRQGAESSFDPPREHAKLDTRVDSPRHVPRRSARRRASRAAGRPG